MTLTEDWEGSKSSWTLLKSSFWLKQAKSWREASRFVAGMTATEAS